jgi:hypothetical protein
MTRPVGKGDGTADDHPGVPGLWQPPAVTEESNKRWRMSEAHIRWLEQLP